MRKNCGVGQTAVLVVAFLGLMGAGVRAYGEDYLIKLDRPMKVGAEFVYKAGAEDTTKQEIWSSGHTTKQETKVLKGELEADMKVLGVSISGKPAWMIFTVKRWKAEAGGKALEGIMEGTVVEIKRGKEQAEITVQNGTLTDGSLKLLAMLLPDPKDADMEDDAALGTHERKQVGDEWKVNPAGIAQNTAAAGVKMDKDDISGTVKILEVKEGAAGKALVIHTKLSMVNMPLPVPASTRVTQASIVSEMTGEYPVDVKIPRVSESSKMELKATVIMPSMEGPSSEMTMDTVREEHHTMVPKGAGK